MSEPSDLETVNWKSADDPIAKYVVLWDDSPFTFWDRLKIAWKFLWMGEWGWPDKLLAYFDLRDEKYNLNDEAYQDMPHPSETPEN